MAKNGVKINSKKRYSINRNKCKLKHINFKNDSEKEEKKIRWKISKRIKLFQLAIRHKIHHLTKSKSMFIFIGKYVQQTTSN